MGNINELEKLYLDAKKSYYEGNPIMSDSAFDELENQLKSNGSSVIENVGYWDRKAKYLHPSRMGSLEKIQANKETGEPPFDEFYNWINNILLKTNDGVDIEFTQKLDGNAINLVYENGKLSHALSRGDGTYGRDYISKVDLSQIPRNCPISDNVVEVRCEAVIKKDIFEKKYAEKFANERNYVAGILNSDEENLEAYSEIDLIPVEMHEVTSNGTILYHNINEIATWGFKHFSKLNITSFMADNINNSDYLRSGFKILFEIYESYKHKYSPYRIDGFVGKIEAKYRTLIGETEHHPKWALAIKFKPENASTEVVGMEIGMGKTGVFTPVILLKPVELDGSVVSRVSGYNYKYVVEKKIGEGAIVTMVKSGDIIPQIISVDSPSLTPFSFPETCPYCGNKLEVLNDTHLICSNSECSGKGLFRFINSFNALELDGVGDSFLEKIYDSCEKDPLYYIKGLKELDKAYFIENGFKDGKILENFLDKLKGIKEITVEKILAFMSMEGISLGGKTTKEIAKKIANVDYSFSGLEKKIVDGWDEGEEKRNRFEEYKHAFEENGINVIYPMAINENVIKLCLTGSPKGFGFKTKKEYLKSLNDKGIACVEANISECDYLVTDDLNGTSSKMKQAKKLNKDIVGYDYEF